MSESPSTDVVKWYTRARKFPQLIGRTPDGMKLWGGPYTITQAVGFGLVLFVGLNTMSLWASFGFIGNFFVLACVAASVVFGLGRIPVGSRSPLSVATGAWKAIASPRNGRIGGKPVRIRRPHRLHHTVLVQLAPSPDTATDLGSAAQQPGEVRPRTLRRSRRAPAPSVAAPATAPQPTAPQPTEPVPAPAPVLTGIQMLLATSTTTGTHRSEETR